MCRDRPFVWYDSRPGPRTITLFFRSETSCNSETRLKFHEITSITLMLVLSGIANIDNINGIITNRYP